MKVVPACFNIVSLINGTNALVAKLPRLQKIIACEFPFGYKCVAASLYLLRKSIMPKKKVQKLNQTTGQLSFELDLNAARLVEVEFRVYKNSVFCIVAWQGLLPLDQSAVECWKCCFLTELI